MGVPKFFRYTSERYPCLNELVKQHQIPDFDNMYLDMNGIIHNCSHPDDSNPHFRITEEKIFQDIFHYLTILFQIIKPKKLFFMAIDGVAPRAKMNQQRGRRFRSAREAEKLEEEALNKGEVLPSEKRFDSNCITPGAVFMARLHEQLKYFIKNKISTDPLWAKVKVILSGHETPGEGEHKIMDYIRWARSQPDYDPTTRHCLYGLDADLIMLGMCTHEPHFALLREEVKFGKTTQRVTSPEETNFYLLHLSLLKEYLEQEFISLQGNLPFEYDIEKIVDDWVLMGFLVGNDFIPNLPNMHIGNDALPLLYKTYMTVLPTLDGYINESGDLNLKRFEAFMQELAKIDKVKFHDTYADLKYFEGKTGRRPNANERKEYKPNNDDTFNVNIDDIKANKPDDELQALISATKDMFREDLDDEDDDDELDIDTSDDEANFNMEFILHKKDYYMNKLDYSKVTDEVLASQAECYVRAIQWNLHYYYRGCASWCWYYPHHYAPYISDIQGFADLDFHFELGEPFKPFEQLLAVLPAASKQLLPTPFHSLMVDEDSPIVHYYPVNFETDLNGKINDWEAVVLIPFIDETNLLSAMAPCYQRLTDEERTRNTHGPMLEYVHSGISLGMAYAPEYFPRITDCRALETLIWRNQLEVPNEKLKRGRLPNAKKDLLFPGFPTMRHLKYRTYVKNAKVKVFDQPSRNENMIVRLMKDDRDQAKLEDIAEECLGQVIWVGWPHLTKAKVISVSNEAKRLHHIQSQSNAKEGKLFTEETNAGNLQKQWISERATILEHNMNRLGIELGEVKVIIHALNLKGYSYNLVDGLWRREEVWCSVPCGYALQATLQHISEYSEVIEEPTLSPEHTVFLITPGQYYGCSAKLLTGDAGPSGRLKVLVSERPEPVPQPRRGAQPYRAANQAAATAGISTQVLSRITGSVLVVGGERNAMATEGKKKVNIGLNLKFNKKNQEVTGYTRRCATSGYWQYSERCVKLVKDYVNQFPELFNKLSLHGQADVFFEGDLWPGEVGKDKPKEVSEWLSKLPHTKAARRECGSNALEPEEIKALADDIDSQLELTKGQDKTVTLRVKWNLVYNPSLNSGNVPPDASATHEVWDRVVSVAPHISVPAARHGTVTAVYPPDKHNTVRLSDSLNADSTYQVLFDEPFPGASKGECLDEPRLYRMLPCNMLNISYGRKLRQSTPSVPDSSFSLSQTPHVLRREDGHHSAFANYSPTKDRQTPVVDTRAMFFNKSLNATPPTPLQMTHNPPDNGTELLKSLLKISQDDSEKTKKNHKKPTSDHDKNWRQKDATNQQQTSQQPTQRNQSKQGNQGKSNWRHDTSNNNELRLRPTLPSQEWTNTNFQGQPVVSFPFSQPFQEKSPGPSQIPFPKFQNFPPRSNSDFHMNFANHFPIGNANQGPSSNNGQYGHQNRGQNGPFPGNLPNVVNSTLAPPAGWFTGQPTQQNTEQSNNKATVDKAPNPFVPLQVQASQRRVHQPPQPRAARAPPPPAAVENVPKKQQVPQSDAPSKPRQQRKRKPRIAANLPFQND